ncbi:MAG: DUF2815 family protein [Gemmatimonadaceae bacterium]|jgi:hypothetical protein|nr:DUF2815 family protein [Gemmatimonadaceae bacterium]
MSIRTILPAGILSYPALAVPAKPMEGSAVQTPKYQATLVYRADQPLDVEIVDGGKKVKTTLVEVIRKVVAAKFGEDKVADILKRMGPGKSFHSPIRVDDEDAPKYATVAGPGARFLRASTTTKPQCAYPDLRLMDDEAITRDLYAGCKARMSVTVAWFDKGGKKGITLYLNNVQKIGEGERIGNAGAPASNDFDAVETTAEDANDLANLLG